ncbi:MAG TPA: family 78 glycoside hydrolase catalytic domain [Opitutus sp.]|nr:family 78 glycoside hydrolase catalytic domain [Opitutus sp.]
MSATHVTHLRCEYLVDPLGIDERAPRLSWALASDRRGARQLAYRVRVASTPEQLARGGADRWDSGRVTSDQTTHVVYRGAPLGARDACHWDVEVWDETGAAVRSAPARWSMGLLSPGDWTARWIAADPEIVQRDPEAIASTLQDCGTPAVFRKNFAVSAGVRRATLYASARGVFELTLGGRRVGEDLFAPEWTDYDKRIHFRTYDVTPLVRPGANTLGATLGDGWWSGFVGWQEHRGRYGSLENSLLVQLEVELDTGERLLVGTDASWLCATGPILSSDFMMGEVFDARRVARDWLPVREVAPPNAALVAQRSEPVRVTETLAPVSRHELRPGVFVYDLGQNISGFVRLRLRGVPAGTHLTLRHAERLNPDGTLYVENLRRAKATDVYIAAGAPEESYQPHFTFHGFQYVELSGFPGTPPDDLVTGCVVHSATPPAGEFECSHADVNRLWRNGVWSQRDNFLSVPTDCPQRDERLGWMGDAQVFLRTATCNMDVAAFFTKWMIDVEDAQTTEGIFPDIAPRLREDIHWTGVGDLGGAAGWADAGVIVPWTIWRVYGDVRIVERHWRAMTAWLDYLERTNPGGLRTRDLHNNYGDWLCIPTDTSFGTHSPMKNFLATAYWADDAAKMATMARALGREEDATRFRAMFERVRGAFQREFLREDGRLTVETQTAYLLALAFDLLPANVRGRAAERLVANIKSLDWHLSTGFIGISHLNPTLTRNGHADVAYRLLVQDTFPSWLYPIKHGATTIWERWNGWTHQDGFFNPAMNSFNHYSLGSVGEWLFRHVAGIELDPEVPGFRRFRLQPFVGRELTFARARYRTMHGEIASEWHREGETLTWRFQVPPNTGARVFIPSVDGPPVVSDGLEIAGRADGFAFAEAEPGRYTVHSTMRLPEC